MNKSGYQGAQTPNSSANEYNAQDFIIKAVLAKIVTMELVRVEAVDTVKQTVDVLPLVHQMDGHGQAVPHLPIKGFPYWRLQGGNGGVICDPVVGDIGLAAFCSRDISSVVATKKPALPSSKRRFDWGDGIYFGGVCNINPTIFVKISAAGITLKAPTVTIDATNVNVTGTLTAATDVITNGKSLKTHVHGGVQSGGSNTGAPV